MLLFTVILGNTDNIIYLLFIIQKDIFIVIMFPIIRTNNIYCREYKGDFCVQK